MFRPEPLRPFFNIKIPAILIFFSLELGRALPDHWPEAVTLLGRAGPLQPSRYAAAGQFQPESRPNGWRSPSLAGLRPEPGPRAPGGRSGPRARTSRRIAVTVNSTETQTLMPGRGRSCQCLGRSRYCRGTVATPGLDSAPPGQAGPVPDSPRRGRSGSGVSVH